MTFDFDRKPPTPNEPPGIFQAHEGLANAHAFFDQNVSDRFTRLPDVIISGIKKCGTKTIQTFLLSHPKIIGSRSETFYLPYSNSFPRNMAAWFYRMGNALVEFL